MPPSIVPDSVEMGRCGGHLHGHGEHGGLLSYRYRWTYITNAIGLRTIQRSCVYLKPIELRKVWLV